ncbi:uncharacterized protein V1518DRAFT_423350 [Limtongia smithiae]|uniref:uncharacterized protein n=1 Tax=Limtongia smithiae TaxID=1125753 RepID=UPI0034CDCF07
MNSLFNKALKQSQSIKRDLDTLASSPATVGAFGLQGQISATLASLERTIDQYDGMARRELVPAKQEKAFARIRNFRTDASDARHQLEELRQQREDAVGATNRAELLGRRTHASATPDNPYGRDGGLGGGGEEIPVAAIPREFVSRTGSQLDEFIERGRAVLGDLVEQRDMLKTTQRKLYSAANTLGVSTDTIKYIERRARQDRVLFWAGIVVVVVVFYLILRLLR